MLMRFRCAPRESARWQKLSPVAGLGILYLGLMCSAITYLLYNYALKGLAASQVSAFLNLVPAIGVITAMLLLGEQIRVVHILGGVVIIIGVIVSARV